MKKILFILLMFVSSLGYGWYSVDDGLWSETSVWELTIGNEWYGSIPPPYSIKDGTSVYINSIVVANSEIDVKGGATLTIGDNLGEIDTLIINAGLISKGGANIIVNSGGVLYIIGDAKNSGGGNITIYGTLIIDGSIDNNWANITVSTGGVLGVGEDFSSEKWGTNLVNVEDGATVAVGGVMNGAFTIANANDTVTNIGDFDDIIEHLGGLSTLPIELLHFTTYYDFDKSVLTWATASEINNDYFIIEYAVDGVLWEVLDYVQGVGNSSTTIDYSYFHYTKNSYYYRLTQVDYNGESETFNVSHVNTPYINDDIEYDVYDMMGRFIVRKRYNEINQYINQSQIYLIVNGLEVKKVKF